jgi:hypothetical protein
VESVTITPQAKLRTMERTFDNDDLAPVQQKLLGGKSAALAATCMHTTSKKWLQQSKQCD